MDSILDSPGLPKRADNPVFNEPWEARTFAITLKLHERGIFTWPEWSAALGSEIALAQSRGDQDIDVNYYRYWLRALEALLAERGTLSPQP
jgi:nitrile hydratase accessory protein